jgi:eukaryotic-like serine/threonine-protein kinase
MNHASTRCPPADVIAAFAFGELSAANAPEVQSHISECELCLQTVGQLARSSQSGPTAVAPEPALAEAGQAIGSYRLVHKLGEGGMGEVWKAEQLAPVRRTVALKLLKAGLDTRQIVGRFESERQVLALMQHPGIAQMFDAGITTSGRPYFVMELVDGQRITEYCDQARLSVQDRLLLFQQVCEAVQHAHQKGFIHRDIKPSNVLVTMQNGRALPKVIDFGLAKVAAPDAPDATVTEIGMVLGTPAYASPEQMSLGVIDVDTRSDVYSLGVLLYELLVGVIPFEVPGGKPEAIIELRRNIRDLEPARPSARLSRLGARSSDIAKRRATEVAALSRQLRGDLDWIVMKALEKDRSRRYASPGDLARDTQRYLRHEPVLAGSPTAAYRMRKFVRRHRAGTAFGVVVISLVVAFAISSVIQLKRIAAERDRATAEAAKASSINTFLVDTLGSADPWQSGADISLRDTLKQAAAKVDTSFKDQPLIAATIRRTIGKTYVSLGRFDEGEPLLNAALEARVKLLGRESADVAESLADRAALFQGRGQFDEAVKQAREALALRQTLLGTGHALVAESLLDLANSLTSKGEYEEATRVAEEALAIRERIFGPESLEVAAALTQVGNLASNGKGDQDRALQLLQRSYDIRRKRLDASDLRIAETEVDMGAACYLKQKYVEAEALYRSGLQIVTRVLGKSHPQAIVVTENLAGALMMLKRYDETLALMDEVLAQRKAVLGESSPQVARTMVNIAMVLSSATKTEESIAMFAEAVPRFAKAYGEEHPDYAVVLQMYTGSLNKAEHFADAERTGRQSIALMEAKFPADFPSTARTRVFLAKALTMRGKFAEAETQLKTARPVFEKKIGVNTPQGQQMVDGYVELYTRWGKPKEAEAIKAQLSAVK